eukprot:TRINITY_DN4637_c0_g1_i5.p1 TRINITY_DN4637_c0_g1~~TRINITY_DN4637_c0_g1_i5.p1  ORF type:complete len:305 (-),score=38.14 TRINITY_DN4637_c0_g1_i5:106-1020(-)
MGCEAEGWKEKVDWYFWGNLFFLLASIGYCLTATAAPLGYCTTSWCNTSDTISATLYIVDSLFFLVGWYFYERPEFITNAQLFSTSHPTLSQSLTHELLLSDLVASPSAFRHRLHETLAEDREHNTLHYRFLSWASQIDWGFWAVFLFLLGSVGYLLTAVLYAQNLEPTLVSFVNFAAAVLFVVDSFFYMMQWYLARTLQPSIVYYPNLENHTPEGEKEPWWMLWMRASLGVDWMFWGHFVFMIASFIYVYAAALAWWWPDAAMKYSVSNGMGAYLFLVDSAIYYYDYYLTTYLPLEEVDEEAN